jgi:hypothetical protein
MVDHNWLRQHGLDFSGGFGCVRANSSDLKLTGQIEEGRYMVFFSKKTRSNYSNADGFL